MWKQAPGLVVDLRQMALLVEYWNHLLELLETMEQLEAPALLREQA